MKDDKKIKMIILEVGQTYTSYYKIYNDEKNIVVSNDRAYYPSNAYLKMNVYDETEIHAIVIAENHYKADVKTYVEELVDVIDELNSGVADRNIKFQYDVIEYSALDRQANYNIINQIIELISTSSDIIIDASCMSRNIFLIINYILQFAEKFLKCRVERIIDRVADTSDISYDYIKDITNLYDISSVIDLMNAGKHKPKAAKQILKQLIS